MADFDEFITFVARLVTWALDWTCNLICLVLLVASMIFPWRWCSMVASMGSEWRQGGFRSYCYGHFVRSLFDLIVIPLALLTCWWPPRLGILVRDMRDKSGKADKLEYGMRLREVVVVHFFQVLGDVLSSPLVVLGLLAPWRCRIAWSRCCHKAYKHSCGRKALHKVRSVGVREGLNALVDAPFVTMALIALIAPWHWWSVLHCFCANRKGESNSKVRCFLFRLPFEALVDWVCLLLGMLALLGLPRLSAFAKALVVANRRRRGARRPHRHPWDNRADTDTLLRATAFRYGLLSLLDFLLLPAMCLVMLTIYRAPQLFLGCSRRRPRDAEEDVQLTFDHLATEAGAGNEGPLTEEQTERLLLAPAIPASYQVRAVRQLCLLLLDIAVLPFALLALLSTYRSRTLLRRGCAGGPGREGCTRWHKVALQEGGLVMHDALLMLPFLLVLILTLYRVRYLRETLQTEPTDLCGPFRRMVWRQTLELLIDLPTIFVLLPLLVTLWRADIAWMQWRKTRRGVWVQLALLLRDMLCLPLAAVLLVSIIWAPGLLLDLVASCRGPGAGEPLYTVARAVLIAQSEGPEGHRPGIDLKLTAPSEPVGQLKRLSLFIRGSDFWETVEATFGSSVALLARSFLPFRMKNGDHVQYADFDAVPNEELNLSWRMGGSTLKRHLRKYMGQLLAVRPDAAVLIQIDYESQSDQRGVLMRVPMSLRTVLDALDNNSANIDLEAEIQAHEAQAFREVFWKITVEHFASFLKDLLHLILFCVALFCPWRWLEMLYFLSRRRAWPSHVKAWAKGLEELDDVAAWDALQRLRRLLHHCGKGNIKANLSSLAEGYWQQSAWVCGPLRRQSDKELAAVWPVCAARLERHRALREGMVQYYTAQMHLGSMCRHHLRRAIFQERLRSATVCLQDMLVRSRSDSDQGWHRAADPPRPRDLATHCRRVVRWQCVRATEDILLIAGMVILGATVYRLPRTVVDAHAKGLRAAKVIVWHNVVGVGRDGMNLFLAVAHVLLCILLLVHSLDLFASLPRCRSLAQVRQLAWRLSRESLSDFCNLFALVFQLKTYRYLVTAAFFGTLMPALALPLPAAPCVVCWLAILTLCVCVPATTLPAILGIPFLALVTQGSQFTQVNGFESASLALSWGNVLSLFGTVADVAFMVEPNILGPNSSAWLIPLAQCLGLCWTLAVSLPFSLPTTLKEEYQSSGLLCAFLHAMLHALFLPTAVGLLRASGPVAQALLLVFVVSVTGSLRQQEHFPKPKWRFDWRHPPLFLAAHRLPQLAFLAAPASFRYRAALRVACVGALLLWALIFALRWRLAASPVAVALRLAVPFVLLVDIMVRHFGPAWPRVWQYAGCAFVCAAAGGWVVQRCRIRRALEGAVPHLVTPIARLRLRLRTALVADSLPLPPLPVTEPVDDSMQRPLLYPRRTCMARLQRNGRWEGCCSGYESRWSVRSLTRALEASEERLGAEQLEEVFLSKRKQWLSELQEVGSEDGRADAYVRLGKLTEELARAIIKAPLTPTSLIAMMRGPGSSRGTRRILEPVWWEIVSFVFDCAGPAELSSALVYISAVAGGPLAQMTRALELVQWVVEESDDTPGAHRRESDEGTTVVVIGAVDDASMARWRLALRIDALRAGSFLPDGVEERYRLGYCAIGARREVTTPSPALREDPWGSLGAF